MTQTRSKRVTGYDRRKKVLTILRQSPQPITGGELADQMRVSRQVIVQDISLLRAKDHPIIATSQGYLFLEKGDTGIKSRTVACRHSFSETRNELNLVVDCGVTVVDVTVEHPLYGEMTGSLMIRDRLDVARFISKMEQTGASLLSSLTDGVHLHRLEAPSEERLNAAIQALKKAGYLLK